MDIREIPLTLGFKVSCDGKVFDSNMCIRNTYVNGDGYETASVKKLDNSWQTYGVHRLVAIAFIDKPIEYEYDDLTVNHRDKDIRNNNKTNLEWCTNSQNNIHAYLFGENNNLNLICRDLNNKIIIFTSLTEAVEKTNLSELDIWDSIKDSLYVKGFKFEYLGSKDKVPEHIKKHGFHNRGTGVLIKRALKILNVQNNEILTFDSIHDAAVYFSVTSSHVFQCISSENKTKLFKRQYLIIDANDDFPLVSRKELEILKNPTGKDVIAFNKNIKKLFIFESASSFIKNAELSKKAITTDLKKRRLREITGWIYCYLDDLELVEEFKLLMKTLT